MDSAEFGFLCKTEKTLRNQKIRLLEKFDRDVRCFCRQRENILKIVWGACHFVLFAG